MEDLKKEMSRNVTLCNLMSMNDFNQETFGSYLIVLGKVGLTRSKQKDVARIVASKKDYLKDCSLKNFMLILHGLCRLDMDVTQTGDEFATEVSIFLAEHLDELGAKDLTTIMYTFERLKYEIHHMGIGFIRLWRGRALEEIEKFSALELSSIAYTLSRLEITTQFIGKEFYRHFTKACVEKMSEFSDSGFINILFSVQRLNLKADSLDNHFYKAWTSECCSRIQTLSVTDLSRILVSLSSLNAPVVSEGFVESWSSEFVSHVDEFDRSQVLSVAGAFTKLKISKSDFCGGFWSVFGEKVVQILNESDEKELFQLIFMFRQLNVTVEEMGQECFLRWCSQLVTCLRSIDASTLTDILFDLSRMRQAEDAPINSDHYVEFFEVLFAGVQKKMSSFDGAGLRKIIMAHANFSLGAEELSAKYFQLWAAEIQGYFKDQFNTRMLSTTLLALSALDMGSEVLGAEFFLSLESAFLSRRRQCGAQEISLVYMALSKPALHGSMTPEFHESFLSLASAKMEDFGRSKLLSLVKAVKVLELKDVPAAANFTEQALATLYPGTETTSRSKKANQLQEDAHVAHD